MFFSTNRSLFVLTLWCRERYEHKIFLTLLESVPGLEEQLVNGSDKEAGIIAELVSCVLQSMGCNQYWSYSKAPKGCLQRLRQQHQELERCHPGMGCSKGPISWSSPFAKCEGWLRVQSRAHRGPYVSCKSELVWSQVSQVSSLWTSTWPRFTPIFHF